MTHIIIIIILHEDLNYSQIYVFLFNHDYKFWTFWTIKYI
jgi:hypothetical protein